VRVDLRGKGKNTRAIGALVKAKADGKTWMRQVTCGRGYLSQADIALTFGVGKAETVDLEIRWPDGETLSIAGVETNKTHRVEQGG
jgi:hypothetical protein